MPRFASPDRSWNRLWARSSRRSISWREVRRRRRRLERHQLRRALPRRPALRALEHAAPRRDAEGAVRHASARKDAPGVFVAASDYMKIAAGRIDRWLPRPMHRARHRRLRPQREPRLAARLLRGRRQVHRLRDARRRSSRRRRSTPRSCSWRSRISGSTRTRRTPRSRRAHAHRFQDPQLGDGIKGGDVLNVLVKVGDTVAKDQDVLELETDKATIEVPSSVAGTVAEIKVKSGDKVTIGQVVLTLNEGGGVDCGQRADAFASRRRLRHRLRQRRRLLRRPHPHAAAHSRAGAQGAGSAASRWASGLSQSQTFNIPEPRRRHQGRRRPERPGQGRRHRRQGSERHRARDRQGDD